MRALRGLLALSFVFGIAQSCTNDFDKFEVGAGGSGATTATRGGNASAGTAPQGGNVIGVGGDNGTAGTAGTGAVPAAGAPGVAGAGGAGCGQVDTNILHCGECDRACDATGVASLECSAGVCVSSCAPGSANCSQPDTGDDDGCETDVSADPDQCGGCDNACPLGFQCASGQCACDNKGDCGSGSGVQCVTGLCECDNTACQPGERCRAAGGSRFCSCNGSDQPGCAANEFCCEAGCTNVVSSAQNCGACGRSCTSGFACVASACECDSDADCSGGEPTGAAGAPGVGGAPGGGGMSSDGGVTGMSGGGGEPAVGGAAGEPASSGGAGGAPAQSNMACVAGRCVCSGNTCAEGQRCLASGSCG